MPKTAVKKKSTGSSKSASNKQMNTGMAVVAYILFFVPLLTDAKDDTFVMFHVKQGLVLLISWILVSIVTSVIPIIGWLLSLVLFPVLIILWLIGIMNAVNGEKKELPIVGQYANKINL